LATHCQQALAHRWLLTNKNASFCTQFEIAKEDNTSKLEQKQRENGGALATGRDFE